MILRTGYWCYRLCLGVVYSAAALALLTGVCAAQSNARSPLGINLRELRYWSTEMPTVDFFKRASNRAGSVWLTQCDWGVACKDSTGMDISWDTREQAQLDLDAAGWPKSLPAADSALKYRYVTTMLWRESDKIPLGRWTVLYDGEGTLSYGQTGVTRNAAASTSGRDVFDVAAGANALNLTIRATDPNKNGNYLRNIRVIAPGGTCDGDPFSYAADAAACPSSYRPLTETYASQPFHPQYLASLRPFASFRVIHLSMTNTDRNKEWAERPRFDEISWGYDGEKGVPIEVTLDLANTLDASPWLEVPHMASDDYVLQFARLAKARLTTTRPIYLEYGNEAWNGMYPYSLGANYVKDQGKARWPTSTESDYAKGMNWFALRTKQICAIWKQEFADRPGQVKCVMGAQGGTPWVTDHYLLSCPLHAAEPGGSACDKAAGINAFAAGYYFGGHVSDTAFQAQIEADWFTQADGGLTRLFQEITDGSALATPAGWTRQRATVAGIATQMAANKLVADQYGVAMLVYEGGNELFGLSTTNAYQIKLQQLIERAQRDPRMGAAYTAVLNHWKANGGHLYAVYESTGRYTATRGNSTLLEWQGQPRSEAPKYDAVLTFMENNPCWWAGCSSVANIAFVPGWNLVGNGVEAPLAVAGAFNDPARVATVWKWVTAGSAPGIAYPAWAFYTPTQGDGGQAYAAGKGYEFLTAINAGEGFWVNAKTALAVPLPAGALVPASSFKPALANPPQAGGAHALPHGWSLIATGGRPTPGQFDGTLATLSAGQIHTNLSTLWAWDASRAGWYFWAPSLVTSGGLAGYLASKGYIDFATLATTPVGTLSPTTGFWVNVP